MKTTRPRCAATVRRLHRLVACLALAAFAALVTFAPPAGAAVPGEVDFQGLLFDSGGQRVNGTVALAFALHPSATGGSALWTETHPAVEVLDGVYQVKLGSVTPIPDDVLGAGPLYLEVTVDGDTLAPRQALLAVPYALRARRAESAAVVTAPASQTPVTNSIEPVDDPVDVNGTSITIGANGLPVVAYSTPDGLRLLTCGDAACSANNTIVDVAPGRRTAFPSVAIGSDGLPIVVYYDPTSGEVAVQKCNAPDCSAISGGSLNTATQACPSIAVGLDGLPLVSYVDTAGDVRIAHCSTLDCRAPGSTFHTIDATASFECTSLAVGVDGRPYVAYTGHTATDFELRVARCSDADCTSTLKVALDSEPFPAIMIEPLLATDSSGLPRVSYLYSPGSGANYALRVGYCATADCASYFSSAIALVGPGNDHGYDRGSQTALGFGADDKPRLAYLSVTPVARELRFAACATENCASILIDQVLDQPPPEETGSYPSLAVPADGRPVIAYRDERGPTLKVLRCANPLCVSNWTRR